MKHRQLRLATTLVVGLVMLTLAACSTGSSGGGNSGEGGGLPAAAAPEDVIKDTIASLEGKKVRMVVYTDDVQLQQGWISEIRDSFAGTGIDFDYAAANFDGQLLVQQAQTAMDQGADALILHNSDLTSLANVIKEAQEKGIYVVVMNLGSNSQSDAFIGPNWLEMADQLASRTADDCDAKGKNKVAILTGFGSDTGSVLTAAGAEATFEDRGLEVVATQPTQYDPAKAGEIARTIIQQHPDICGFLGNWDGMMLGVSKVVRDLDLVGEVGVYTTDSSQASCEAIGDGSMTVAVNYQGGRGMGVLAAGITKYLLQGGQPAGEARTAIFTATELIDKSNYQRPDACYGTPTDWTEG